MKQNRLGNTFLEWLVCLFEKNRIIARSVFRIPSDRQVIIRINRHLKKYLPLLVKNDIRDLPDFESESHNASAVRSIQSRIGDEGFRVLLVTHELSLTGAPKTALVLAKTLKSRADTQVVVLSMVGGPMQGDFEDEGIPLILFDEMPFMQSACREVVQQFDLVVVNSISWDFFSILKGTTVPVAWWVHEFFLSKSELSRVRVASDVVDVLLAVSPVVERQLREACPDKACMPLIYGLESLEVEEKRKKGAVTVTLIGAICKRKGTDLFVEAIERLTHEIKSYARFIIIGPVLDEALLESVRKRGANLPELDIRDAVPFDELLDVYAETDVVVCASRVDPMPIVVTHAFMFSRICILSDAIGTAQFVRDGENAILFKNEDVNVLAEKIEMVIKDRGMRRRIGAEGRLIYEDNFSMTSFEEGVERIIRDYACIDSVL